MDNLNIPASHNTPQVVYDPDSATFSMVGTSIPENAGAFYGPVVQWLQAHARDLPDDCTFIFSLPYFNSSSLKAIYTVLLEVKKAIDMGRNFTVNWHVEDQDDFMTEAGETYQDMLGMTINLTPGSPMM